MLSMPGWAAQWLSLLTRWKQLCSKEARAAPLDLRCSSGVERGRLEILRTGPQFRQNPITRACVLFGKRFIEKVVKNETVAITCTLIGRQNQSTFQNWRHFYGSHSHCGRRLALGYKCFTSVCAAISAISRYRCRADLGELQRQAE